MFIVVRKLSDGYQYAEHLICYLSMFRIEIASKAAVPAFRPEVKSPVLFKGPAMAYFREYIIAKGERLRL